MNKGNAEFDFTLIWNDKLVFLALMELQKKIFQKLGLPFFSSGINGKLNFKKTQL